MKSPTTNHNISLLLAASAARFPDKDCLVVANPVDAEGRSTYRKLSFGQLEARVDTCARGIEAMGIAGSRVLVMIRPGFDLVTAVFALLRAGAVPVFIDEGMGTENMLRCIEEVKPGVLFAIPRGLELKAAFPESFKSVEIVVCVGDPCPQGATSFADLLTTASGAQAAAQVEAEDLSLILFTTGSTGTPKGVQYTPRVVHSQLDVMKRTWGLTERDVDLSTFPTFVVGTIAIGMTVVVPDIDPANPGQVDPARIVQAIRDQGTTYTFGPPALWNKVTRHCVAHGIQLPSMRHVLVAGAPVPASLIRRFQRVLPNGACATPIGATEANPITNIGMQELIEQTLPLTDAGHGVCVGRPLPGHDIRVIAIDDGVIADWSQARVLGTDEIGELVVSGPVVTHHYFGRPEATAKAKIYGGPNGVAHRLGDTGFIDAKGRVWFCGRRAHVVEAAGRAWYPLQVESAFNCERDIWRSALVGVTLAGEAALALCIEFDGAEAPTDWRVPSARLAALREKARRMRVPLQHFLACPQGFPVDIRHNSKINRPALGCWAEELLAAEQAVEAAEAQP
jgi:acyl-coenzyme A synthetase/AMP-(fatty) acid ligase